MKLKPQQIILLRVGIDSGCGGIAGPLFKNDAFEFIPIPSYHAQTVKMYGNCKGVKTNKPLIDFFPSGKRASMKDNVSIMIQNSLLGPMATQRCQNKG